MNPLELTLGIMTAVGGFVDISELVFAAKAGSTFGYALIWVFALATIGIMVFGEMSGRVAAVAKQPVFNLMRHRLGLKLGLVTLVASLVSTLITCAAEVGGIGLILHYLTGAPYLLMAAASTLVLMASMWVLPFKWIERIYGLLGLLMIAFRRAGCDPPAVGKARRRVSRRKCPRDSRQRSSSSSLISGSRSCPR